MRHALTSLPRGAIAAAMLVLTGCAVHEPRTNVQMPMPASWAEADGASIAQAAVSQDWWRGFGSTSLEALVQEALLGSSDLRIAAERVRQADIALQSAGTAQLPGVSASAGSSGAHREGSGTSKSTSLSLSVSYEVDLWGRIAADIDAARAQADATRLDMETARITLTASVATTYFQLLAQRERMEIARHSLATAERVLKVVQSKARNGVATPLEVSQQTTTVLQQRTALVPLQEQQRQTATALALLLGRTAVSFHAGDGETLQQMRIPVAEPGLPSQLLARRPDLKAAEARLAGADADVAAARAALLPSFSLSASGGVGSAALLSLAGGTGSVSLAASLAQTLFDGGRRNLQIDLARSQREVLVETYAGAVRQALKEVQDGLGNADSAHRQEIMQGEVVEQAQRSLDLAERRYREGVDTLLTVLEAQRTLFTAQDSLVQLRQSRLTAAVDLYRVLGGGWSAQPAPPQAGPA